jgi:hypothetical protein
MPISDKAFGTLKKDVEDIKISISKLKDRKRWRIIGISSAVVALGIGLTAHLSRDFRSRVDEQIGAKLVEPLKQLNAHGEQLSAIQSSVERMQHDLDLIMQKELKIVSMLPPRQFQANLDLVGADVRVAADRKLKIDRKIISDLEAQLRSAPPEAKNYWSTISAFLQMATDSNVQLNPVSFSELPTSTRAPTHQAAPQMREAPGFPQGKIQRGWRTTMKCSGPPIYTLMGDLVPIKAGAEYLQIGMNQPADVSIGPSLLMVEGAGDVYIDGYKVRNVIFQNVHIIYGGGPLILKNVSFVNCTFTVPARPQSRGIVLALLSVPTINFKTS